MKTYWNSPSLPPPLLQVVGGELIRGGSDGASTRGQTVGKAVRGAHGRAGRGTVMGTWGCGWQKQHGGGRSGGTGEGRIKAAWGSGLGAGTMADKWGGGDRQQGTSYMPLSLPVPPPPHCPYPLPPAPHLPPIVSDMSPATTSGCPDSQFPSPPQSTLLLSPSFRSPLLFPCLPYHVPSISGSMDWSQSCSSCPYCFLFICKGRSFPPHVKWRAGSCLLIE